MAIGVVDGDGGLGKNNVATLVSKQPQANEGMGEGSLTYLDIAVGGREDANTMVALVTKRLG